MQWFLRAPRFQDFCEYNAAVVVHIDSTSCCKYNGAVAHIDLQDPVAAVNAVFSLNTSVLQDQDRG